MRAVILLAMMVTLTSCSSWLESTRQTVTGDEGPRQSKQSAKWVSKAQYDDLMVKYKNLLNEYDNLKNSKTDTSPNVVGDLAESVDVFKKDDAPKVSADKSLSVQEASREMKLYRKSEALYFAGKNAEALRAFQLLQKSPTAQISVRAKRYVAQIYMGQEQYDLALQVLEEIIQTQAFSAVALDALKSAVVCCQKLGLEEKRAQYQSMLKDVFNLG